jgi:hypothetical protein
MPYARKITASIPTIRRKAYLSKSATRRLPCGCPARIPCAMITNPILPGCPFCVRFVAGIRRPAPPASERLMLSQALVLRRREHDHYRTRPRAYTTAGSVISAKHKARRISGPVFFMDPKHIPNRGSSVPVSWQRSVPSGLHRFR